MNLWHGFIYIILGPILGGLLAGIDRKISARLQGRRGPSILQPFYDVFKLFQKEIVVVNKLQDFFIMFFFIFMVFTGILFFSGGDILLVIFSLTLASIFLVVGAHSTNSPYSSIGAERELLQMMAYEPVVLLTAVGFYICTGSFNIMEIAANSAPAICYIPGIFIAFIFILNIKLRKSPSDISTSHHGHQEIVKGITTEFAGANLAIVELAHWYENVLLLGMVGLFFLYNSTASIIGALIASSIVYFIQILIDNVFARAKWYRVLDVAWMLGLTLVFLNIIVII